MEEVIVERRSDAQILSLIEQNLIGKSMHQK
jgi:hypothetical protein